jgi:hypothetical protein
MLHLCRLPILRRCYFFFCRCMGDQRNNDFPVFDRDGLSAMSFMSTRASLPGSLLTSRHRTERASRPRTMAPLSASRSASGFRSARHCSEHTWIWGSSSRAIRGPLLARLANPRKLEGIRRDLVCNFGSYQLVNRFAEHVQCLLSL